MKKEINTLLASDNGTLKINDFCTLHRWQTIYGSPERVDELEARFSITSAFDTCLPIKARTLPGIIDELKALQTIAFVNACDKLNKELENGYIG